MAQNQLTHSTSVGEITQLTRVEDGSGNLAIDVPTSTRASEATVATLATQVTAAEIKTELGLIKTNLALKNDAATTPTIYNIDLAVVDTEYSQALPANTKAISFKRRTSATVRFAFVTGKVAASTAPYITLPADGAYSETNLNLSSKTIYFGAAVIGVVELIVWT